MGLTTALRGPTSRSRTALNSRRRKRSPIRVRAHRYSSVRTVVMFNWALSKSKGSKKDRSTAFEIRDFGSAKNWNAFLKSLADGNSG
jgi:hypothetical protein